MTSSLNTPLSNNTPHNRLSPADRAHTMSPFPSRTSYRNVTRDDGDSSWSSANGSAHRGAAGEEDDVSCGRTPVRISECERGGLTFRSQWQWTECHPISP